MSGGPEDFGGSDEGSHYASQTAARKLRSNITGRTPIYIAAPYEMRDEAIRIKGLLEGLEYDVTSTWLTTLDEEGDKGARMDVHDVARADALLLLNPEEYRRSGTGGRHCEFMHAWTLGKQVTILGVRSNIFHHLSNVRVIERLEDF